MLTPDLVKDTFYSCMYDEETTKDLAENALPEGAILVEGIIHKFGLNPTKVEQHKQVILEMFRELPDEFMVDGGGGMSMLNACMDNKGVQWVSEHRTIELLFVLGMALGCARPCLPKELWGVFPSSMPYFMVDLDPDKLNPWVISAEGRPPMVGFGDKMKEAANDEKDTVH